jgi:hypothetical protein
VDAGKAFCVGTSGQNPSNFGLRRLDATREDQCSVTKVDEGDVAAFRNAPVNYGWSPVIVGAGDLCRLAGLGILYSLTSGAALVLRVSGAVPADPTKYAQLHNLVESLAIGEGIPKPAVYVIDDPSPNAFATGLSPDKAAITFTTGCSPS